MLSCILFADLEQKAETCIEVIKIVRIVQKVYK